MVTAPTSGYAGTLYTVEGIERTKTITVREWRDYSLSANMQAYANSLFLSMRDVVIEGSIGYLGLPTNYLNAGRAVSITGAAYSTGWESLWLPVVSLDITFQAGPEGTSYSSTLHLSNRRNRFTGDVFVRPAVTGQQMAARDGRRTPTLA